MRISTYAGVAFAATLFSLASAYTQVIAPLSHCIQQCIDQSSHNDCHLTDIKCLCQGSDSVSLVTCMRTNCDKGFDINLLLSPLQAACELAGVPMPQTALRNSGGRSSSLAAQPTTTLTRSITNTTPNPIGPGTARTPATTNTVSRTTVGGTITQGYTSTIASAYTTTDSAGDVKTMITTNTLTRIQTQSSSASASDGSGSTAGSAGSDVSGGSPGSTTATTTVATEIAVSSASKTVQTGSAKSPDSAPFQMQAAAAKVTSNWMGMTACLGSNILVLCVIANT